MKTKGPQAPPENARTKELARHSVALERRGIGAAPGIVMGPVFCALAGAVDVPRYKLEESGVSEELARFEGAVLKSVEQIDALKLEIKQEAGPAADELADLLDAHIQMLSGSRLVRGVKDRIQGQHLNAEASVQESVGEIARQYETIRDSYLAGRIHDIREVSARLTRNLMSAPIPRYSNIPDGSIIFADEITPADAALMDPARVRGFAAIHGGAEGHTAIMARSLGIPAVLGVSDLLGHAKTGDLAILDGRQGRILINPTENEIEDYKTRRALEVEEQRKLGRLRTLPSVTKDDITVRLSANTELPIEVSLANENGAEGIGLVRTEFMFLNRSDLPSEDEQFEALSSIVLAMDGRSVTLRTLDIGGEKFSDVFKDQYGDESPNPALGLRAIRFSMTHKDLFEKQIGAILRVAELGPIRILLPMITNADEVRAVRRLIENVAIRHYKDGILKSNALPPIGVMIEVPAAALGADALASTADFFSIGTNDLTMYTLAIDRANDQVATLYDPLHPAVLRLIQFTINAGRAAGIAVNICGEMAGDVRMTPLLVGLGIEELSMNANAIPGVKARIRSLDGSAARRCADTILQQSDRSRIEAILSDFNELFFFGR
jgi:phosphoenolpyruvate-protein phosphotransferase (PTS system enzyme I)